MKRIKAHKFSEKFISLLNNENKSLDINEYDYCLTEWANAHESKMIRYYIYTIILFVGGMWAVYEQVWIMAVLLLALAANYNLKSSHHILMAEIITLQKTLAMFINKSTQEPTKQEK